MNNIPMKKILITLDKMSIERLDRIVKHLNECPEEGGGWNRSRAIRIMIYRQHKEFFNCTTSNKQPPYDEEH